MKTYEGAGEQSLLVTRQERVSNYDRVTFTVGELGKRTVTCKISSGRCVSLYLPSALSVFPLLLSGASSSLFVCSALPSSLLLPRSVSLVLTFPHRLSVSLPSLLPPTYTYASSQPSRRLACVFQKSLGNKPRRQSEGCGISLLTSWRCWGVHGNRAERKRKRYRRPSGRGLCD